MIGDHVHILGIGGVMMSAIARILRAAGHEVSGSDAAESDYTRALRAEGITVHLGHTAANVAPDVAWLAVSAAVPEDNPEVVEARLRDLPVRSRAEVLGDLVNPRLGVACAGTHGKTTTSGLAAVLFTEAGLDPTFLVGSVVSNYATNGRAGEGDWIVVEADEYARAFLWLRPTVAIVANVENDHPDIYRDFDDYVATFRAFVAGVKPAGLLLLGADCPVAPSLAVNATCASQTYGFAAGADWHVTRLHDRADGLLGFDLRSPDGVEVMVETRMVGRHNALNATAAIAAAVFAGVPLPRAAALAARFTGTQRRFERLVDRGGILVVDDYAHHPAEVRATVEAARRLGRRVRVVYEPHQYARTRALLGEYAGVFEQADEALVCDIYRAREADLSGVSSEALAAVAGGDAAGVAYVGSHAAARDRLIATAGANEVWLVMGAGDVTRLAHELADWVRRNR